MSEQQLHDFDAVFAERVTRRGLLKRAAAAGAAVGLAPYLATSRAFAATRTIKIGYVTPRTGPLAGFGEADAFVINQIGHVFRKGLKIGKNTFPVQILGRDSQSRR